MASVKSERRQRIKYRIRKKLAGTTEKPRLSVFRSNTRIYAQVIDDTKGQTVVFASSIELDAKKVSVNVEDAKKVGLKLAEKALAAGINAVVFDRNGYLYHGKVKALADGAREGGLKF
jgi:large subunit ribosomal protein L18